MQLPDEEKLPEPESPLKSGANLLKVREMTDYVMVEEGYDEVGEIWLKPLTRIRGLDKETCKSADLRQAIEPWLTALFQSEHFSLLVGGGLTTSIHKQITGKSPTGFDNRTYEAFNDEIQMEASRSANASGRGDPNVEDQLRAALMLFDGLRILLNLQVPSKATGEGKSLQTLFELLKAGIATAIRELVAGILKSENLILHGTQDKREDTFRRLLSFLMSFASRTGTRDRLHLFTTNYDRVLEFGAELAGLRLIDRFVGSLAPIFRSSRLDLDLHYNPPGIRGEPRYLEGVARFTKLHGSLDLDTR